MIRVLFVCGLFFLAGVDAQAESVKEEVSLQKGKYQIVRITPETLDRKLEDRSQGKLFFHLVDLRLEVEFNKDHISGAINIPSSKLTYVAEKIFGKTDEIVFYGYSDKDPAPENAVVFLAHRGFKAARILKGGMQEWKGLMERRLENHS